jgi:hypothetical protein
VSNVDPSSGISRSTVEGQAVGFASDLSGQQGWRRGAGRTIAFVGLALFAALVVAILITIVAQS